MLCIFELYIYIDTVKFHNILYFEIFLFFSFLFTYVETGVKKLFLTHDIHFVGRP